MMIYNPPLLLRSQDDMFAQNRIKNTLLGFNWDFIYTGKYIDKQKTQIELSVSTWVIDHDENLYMRCCTYSGNRSTWKQVIKDQLYKMMGEIDIEVNLIKSETRYFMITQEKYIKPEA
ncbi:hypothetical protein [Autumnicola psychrophila]|uniref:Uncharacterized protein n=1 Tax=Autumnicola psychrophila TaxID=3075592 RepID=A0ABU3DPD8_9FLAO|nr:hypothetical protein [Zunongwangia sp. F225]MDT0685586.1 hypothetical protein [Zunongwangia sp. F225]